MVDDQRVTGVVAALEADDALRLLGQPVDDLALAFVAPLGPDHHHVSCHLVPRFRPDVPLAAKRR